ncbi:Cytochrome P450 71D10 [Linum perenne]
MELNLVSLAVVLPVLLFILMLLRTSSSSYSKSKQKQHPPGPWKLPIIGNIHQLLSGGALPHHCFRDLAKRYGPLMHLQLGETSNVIVSSPEIAKEIMKTHDANFSNRPYHLQADIISYNMADLVFAPYGNFWRQLRKVCVLELLSPSRVKSFRSIREEENYNLVRGIVSSSAGAAGGSLNNTIINLSKMIFANTYTIVARAVFGKVCQDQEDFLPYCQQLIEIAGGFSISDLFPSVKLLQKITGIGPQMERLHLEVDKVLERILDEHKSRAGKSEATDLVDVLLQLQQQHDLGFSLTTNNIKAVILDIFLAGSETASTTVEWAMSQLLRNPIVMQKAQAEVRRVFAKKGKVDEDGLDELDYLKLIIKETLRLNPPVPLLLPRESNEPCDIQGYLIPGKTKVMVNVWAMGRDPSYWVDPEDFKPERFINSAIDFKGTNYEYLPFGAGRRMCPGITFAVPNVELPLANLLFHFNWELPDGANPLLLDMTESFGATVRRKNDLLLLPKQWNPLSLPA